jgi:hypothetical protein
MSVSIHGRSRLAAVLAILVFAAIVVPAAPADDWARDRAATVAYQELDPAIRTAIESRTPVSPTVVPATAHPAPDATSDGFAWGAAMLGMLAGVAAMCVALACVTLVRHDGRLRSA